MSDNSNNTKSVGAQLAEKVLVGAVNSIARAGAKFVQSLAADARKTLQNNAETVEAFEKGIDVWSKIKLGEIIDPNENKQKKENAS